MTTFAPRTSDIRSAFPRSTVFPGDATYDEARLAWNLAADQNAAAVAFPESADDVVDIVRAARANGLRIAPQGTGHNATPLGDLSDTVLMKTERMRRTHIDPERLRGRAEAGTWWDDVVQPASPMGLSMLHGSSPNVGVVGYSLGGGIGWQARKRGLSTNSLTAIELVTANGELIRADHDNHTDLFWAMRGGGGNFGIATAVEFALYPMKSAYAGWLIFPWERSHEVLSRWSEWTREAPEEVTSVGRILQLPPIDAVPAPLRGRNIVAVEATYLGDEQSGRALLKPLRDLGPEMDTFAVVPPAGLARLHMDPEDPLPGMGDQALLDRFDADAIEAFVSVAGPGSGSPMLSAEVRHLGGAAGRPAPDAGALSHIDGEYISFGVGIHMGPESAIALDAHLHRYVRAMEPFGHGKRYLNFAETKTDVASFYGETTFDRLQRIRAQMDPDGLFRSNHEIPPAE
jgi:FAD/FMN-containing dehydrogenase